MSPLLLALVSCGADREPPGDDHLARTATTGSTAATGETGPDTGLDCTPGPDPEPPPCDTTGAPFSHCGCVTTAIQLGNGLGQVVHAIAPITDGGVVVAGAISGPITFGSGEKCTTTLVPDGSYGDGFVARYTAGGQLVWVRQQANSVDSTADAVAVGPSGRVAAGGIYGVTPVTVSGGGVEYTLPYEGDDAYAVVYDATGRVLWAVALTSLDGSEYVEGLTFGPAGELYVAGHTQASSLTLTSTNGSPPVQRTGLGPGGFLQTDTSGFLARVDPDGTVRWLQVVTGGKQQDVQSVMTLADRVIAAGEYVDDTLLDPGGPTELSLAGNGGGTPYVASYSFDGAVLGATIVDTTSANSLGGVAPSANGFVLGGQFGKEAVWAVGTPQEVVFAPVTGALGWFSTTGTLDGVSPFYLGDLTPFDIKAIAAGPEGALGLAGNQSGVATFDPGGPHEVTVDADPANEMAWDPLLLVFDVSGALDCFWHLDGMGGNIDEARAVAFDTQGGVWVGGRFYDTLILSEGRPDARTLVNEPGGGPDLFLVRYALRP